MGTGLGTHPVFVRVDVEGLGTHPVVVGVDVGLGTHPVVVRVDVEGLGTHPVVVRVDVEGLGTHPVGIDGLDTGLGTHPVVVRVDVDRVVLGVPRGDRVREAVHEAGVVVGVRRRDLDHFRADGRICNTQSTPSNKGTYQGRDHT